MKIYLSFLAFWFQGLIEFTNRNHDWLKTIVMDGLFWHVWQFDLKVNWQLQIRTSGKSVVKYDNFETADQQKKVI